MKGPDAGRCYGSTVSFRGGTVHRWHGSVRTSVRGSRFGTFSVQQEKNNKSTILGFFSSILSFILNRVVGYSSNTKYYITLYI